MLKTLVSLVLAALVVGAVLLFAGVMIVFLGQDWDDLLFLVLAALLLVSGLLVVTARHHPLGLAMIVCFGALAGHLRAVGAPLVARRPGARLHRRHQRADPVRDHAHPVQGRPGRLVFQTQAGPAALAAVVLGVVIALAVDRDRLGRGRPSASRPATTDVA